MPMLVVRGPRPENRWSKAPVAQGLEDQPLSQGLLALLFVPAPRILILPSHCSRGL